MSKWHKFHSQYSILPSGSINFGSNDVRRDWQRLVTENVTINGIPLRHYAQQYAILDSTQTVNLKHFFKEIILKDLDDEINKENIIDYLMTSFHQGGLMYPASSPLSQWLGEEHGLQPLADREMRKRELQISTTSTGFKVQEIYASKQIVVISDKNPKLAAKAVPVEDYPESFLPDSDEDYVLKVGALIDVDFTNAIPKVTVESNFVSYGNSAITDAFDNRNFFQVIIDFFRKLFDANSLEKVSEAKPDINLDLEIGRVPSSPSM